MQDPNTDQTVTSDAPPGPGSLPSEAKGQATFDRRTFLTGAAGLAATGLGARTLGLASRAAPLRYRSGKLSAKPMTFLNFYAPGNAQPPLQVKWFEKLVADWNKTHTPRVQLQYIPNGSYMNGPNVYTQFASGHGPDIFLISPGDFTRYANGNIYVDLSDHMTAEARADYYAGVIASRTVNGKIYALPMEVEPMAFYYSVDAFEKAHLSEADLPKTWSELLDVAKRVAGPKRFGVQFETIPGYYQNFTWYPFLWETRNFVVDKNGKTSGMATHGAEQALALWHDAVQSGVAPRKSGGSGGFDIIGGLASGYCAIQNCGIWGIAALRQEAPHFRYGVFKLPVPPGGKYGTILGGWAFAANAKGSNPDAAAEFCVWALGSMDPACIQRGYEWIGVAKSDIAPRKSVLKLANEHGVYSSGPMKYFRDVVFPGGRGEPRFPPPVYEAVSTAIQATQLGSTSPATAAEMAVSTINGYLSGYSGIPVSDQAEAMTTL